MAAGVGSALRGLGARGSALGDLVDNHLVPVYFFLDAEGRITEKAVGQKDSFEMRRLVNQFLDRVEAKI